jgi:cytochrome c oxidase subunit I
MSTAYYSGSRAGIGRWIATTNHKDIGTLYLLFALAMFVVGVASALLLRAELFQPGLQFLSPERYAQLNTLHALVMVFGVALPALSGIANWQLPLMIGAPDTALPRLNNLAFWLLPFAFVLLLAPLFLPQSGGIPVTGWTLAPPLSLRGGAGTDSVILALQLVCVSGILGALNIIATALNMRAVGMTPTKMPFLVWTLLIAAVMLLLALPVLGGALTLLLADRHFGTQFFNAAGGGDPLLWRHLFWFFGQPAIHALVLVAAGIVATVLPAFARKPLFGYRSLVYAALALAPLAFLSWGSQLSGTGLSPAAAIVFMFAAMLLAVPAGVMVGCWIATLWRGALSFETPMLFGLASALMFTVAGLAGLMLAVTPAGFLYRNSSFFTAQLHTLLVGGVMCAVFAAVYFWLPKWTGRRCGERLGAAHFWFTIIGVGVAFFPQFLLGLGGMPRRAVDYALPFEALNSAASAGALVLALAQIPFFVAVWRAWRGGERVPEQVWDGAEGLEWTLPSPPPWRSFAAGPKARHTLARAPEETGRGTVVTGTQGGYHLPSPSRGPFVLALALFVLALSAVFAVNGFAAGRWTLLAGIVGAVISVRRWFTQVIRESEGGAYNRQVDRSFRWGLTWFIVADIMFFVVLFGALFYLRRFAVPWLGADEQLWPGFDATWPTAGPKGPTAIEPDTLPGPNQFSPLAAWGIPAFSTLALMSSSAAVTWAHRGMLRDDRARLVTGLFLAVALGMSFVALQAFDFMRAYFELGLTLSTGVYGATFFLLTGFHTLHAVLGVVLLVAILARVLRGHFRADRHFAFEAVAWFWHFVDVTWLFLFVLVYWF